MSQLITLEMVPDGRICQVACGTTVASLAAQLGEEVAVKTVGARLDDRGPVIDVHTPLRRSGRIELALVDTDIGLEVLRHSAAHLLASAVQRLFPGTQVTIGPAIEQGFYYDFAREGGFTPEHLETIAAEMHRLAEQKLPFVREEIGREQAMALFAGMGEHYKCEILQQIPADETITLYRHGNWVDLCRGPHVPHTGWLKFFALTHVAGAYWRGDERNPMLARIYGTAFWRKDELKAHLHMLEEAQRRDHRLLGKQLELFTFHPLAPAMPFFLPDGAWVYRQLTELMRRYYQALGFVEVITPQVFDKELFVQSGHYAHYRDNMYVCEQGEREFCLKPMNCPGHALLFAASKRSYRDLPLRMADFGRLHRYERSGVTAGLLRVRGFCQDDAHLFCREAAIGAEIAMQLDMLREVYSLFGFKQRFLLSTRPTDSLGRESGLSSEEIATWDALWQRAETQLQQTLAAQQMPYSLNPGDGAFYGPKIDVNVQDALGRWHQLGTIQLDFGLPRRFALHFINEQGEKEAPVMIHRAVLGSLERFMGILIEHCGGEFPLWLAPWHARILPVSGENHDYAEQVAAAAMAAGLRVHIDERSETLGFRMRACQLKKLPFVLVVGRKEQEQGLVALRQRQSDKSEILPLDQAIATMVVAAKFPQPQVRA